MDAQRLAAERLKAYLAAHELSLRQAAKDLGLSQPRLSLVMTGNVGAETANRVIERCDELDRQRLEEAKGFAAAEELIVAALRAQGVHIETGGPDVGYDLRIGDVFIEYKMSPKPKSER